MYKILPLQRILSHVCNYFNDSHVHFLCFPSPIHKHIPTSVTDHSPFALLLSPIHKDVTMSVTNRSAFSLLPKSHPQAHIYFSTDRSPFSLLFPPRSHCTSTFILAAKWRMFSSSVRSQEEPKYEEKRTRLPSLSMVWIQTLNTSSRSDSTVASRENQSFWSDGLSGP